MDTIEQFGFNVKPFMLTCSHCLKNSATVAWEDVNGKEIIDVIEQLGFIPKITLSGGAYTLCSKWCRWRHGKARGIHRLLNWIGHKSNAFKE